jgi:NifU-like protein involved in Fe-S cluster formation
VAREFSDVVLDHFRNPRHTRPLPWPHGSSWVRGRDETRFVRIQVCLAADRVSEIGFGTYGCAPAIACGSWVCEWAVGRAVAEVYRLTAAAVLEGLGGLPAGRQEHADMTVRALHQAVSMAVSNPPKKEGEAP